MQVQKVCGRLKSGCSSPRQEPPGAGRLLKGDVVEEKEMFVRRAAGAWCSGRGSLSLSMNNPQQQLSLLYSLVEHGGHKV